eukprot:4228371-Pyramimonas_sp.AAC.1
MLEGHRMVPPTAPARSATAPRPSPNPGTPDTTGAEPDTSTATPPDARDVLLAAWRRTTDRSTGVAP